MIADASARLSLPHLPGGLATRLKAAGNDPVLRAQLLAEAAAGLPGRPDDFGSALAEDHDRAGQFPGWPAALIGELGRAAEGIEAVMLSEALACVDPARHAFFGGRAPLALAEAGLADDARVKIAEQVELWPDDVQSRMLSATRSPFSATPKRHSPSTRPPCRWPSGPRTTGQDVSSEKIFRLTHSGSAHPAVQRRQPRSKPSRSQRKGKR